MVYIEHEASKASKIGRELCGVRVSQPGRSWMIDVQGLSPASPCNGKADEYQLLYGIVADVATTRDDVVYAAVIPQL